ncbi:glycosyltransferase family 2 protein [Candidatus Woesearchaeota archaeon]|nr:glycosyltransferase family 2 protein [Candidatus Woesearchaeota archaeon]
MGKKMKIAIFIIAYQAVRTLISAIERIPDEIKKRAEEIYVFDDCSDDNTYYAGLGYKYRNKVKKLNIYRNKENLGYGGNQKKGYNYAIKKGYDVVVMLHGDVQYAPEYIPQLIKPIIEGKADASMGSRFLGNPLAGGMPIWKYFGNRLLTAVENAVLGLRLSEYHTGFRAYRIDALKDIAIERCTDGYSFDTDILIQLHIKKKRIAEIPIPTHYGPESHNISFRNSIVYGLNIMKSLIQYRLQKSGIKKIHKFDIK